MKLSILRTIAITLILSFNSCSGGESRDASRGIIQSELQRILDSLHSQGQTPGLSMYVKSGTRGNFAITSGTTTLAGTPTDSDQMTKDTIFRIGSITKTFTGAAILRLIDMDKLDVDAKISTILEMESPYFEQITVRNLLNQSSGLNDYLNGTPLTEEVLQSPLNRYSPQQLITMALQNTPHLDFIPGSKFDYTNTNYVLLGMIAEAVSGLPYEQFLKKEFFEPLGLRNSYVMSAPPLPSPHAHGYIDANDDDQLEDFTELDMSHVWSAGCIASTPKDIANWIYHLGKRELFSHQTTQLMFEGTAVSEDAIYSSGILVDNTLGIGHNGTVFGFHGDAWYNPELDAAIVVIGNANDPSGMDLTRTATIEATEILRLYQN